MNFDYLGHKYCCNCDWLQFSLLCGEEYEPELTCPDGFRLEVLPGNNIFKHRAILSRCSDGAKFFTLLWCPYSSRLKSNIMTCQIANYCLYSSSINMCFNLLQQVVDCAFNSMGRIDVCLDFEVSNYELMFIRSLWIGEYYVERKSEGSSFWHSTNDGIGRNVHCMSWGSKSSEIKVKIYNKSRELGISNDNPMGDKPYIVEEWIRAGMDINRVWRMEFSICSSGQLRWNDDEDGQKVITLEDVRNQTWLLQLFCKMYESRFVCRRDAGLRNGHHNNDPRVQLLVLPPADVVVKWKDVAEDACSTEEITLLRKMMNSLEMALPVANDKVFARMAEVIFELTSTRQMENYFVKCWGDTPQVVLQRLYDAAGEGIREEFPNLSRSIE